MLDPYRLFTCFIRSVFAHIWFTASSRLLTCLTSPETLALLDYHLFRILETWRQVEVALGFPSQPEDICSLSHGYSHTLVWPLLSNTSTHAKTRAIHFVQTIPEHLLVDLLFKPAPHFSPSCYCTRGNFLRPTRQRAVRQMWNGRRGWKREGHSGEDKSFTCLPWLVSFSCLGVWWVCQTDTCLTFQRTGKKQLRSRGAQSFVVIPGWPTWHW